MNEIWKKKIWPKYFFWSIMKVLYPENIRNMSQGLPNPGFRSVKIKTEDFIKKDSQYFKYSFQVGFWWIPSKHSSVTGFQLKFTIRLKIFFCNYDFMSSKTKHPFFCIVLHTILGTKNYWRDPNKNFLKNHHIKNGCSNP